MTEHPPPSDDGASPPARPADARLDAAQSQIAELRQQLAAWGQRAEEQARQSKLIDEELQHRARNTMALVRSAFRRTVETGESLEDVEMHFCGRLDVLTHYMLPRAVNRNALIDLETLVREELRNFEFGDAPGITVDGPSAKLSLEQAQPFALAVHELVTNSLKFGALSGQNGAALSVNWSVHSGRLTFVWTETGVSMVTSAPARKGFGQEYIEDALPYQINAETRFERKPGGVVCKIVVPLSSA